VSPEICPWYTGISFFEALDALESLKRLPGAPLRIPVLARYKERGVLYILGKVESGTLVTDQIIRSYPTLKEFRVATIQIDEVEVPLASPGENVLLTTKAVEEEEIQTGYVLSYPNDPPKICKLLDAQIVVLDLLPHKPLITAGYQCVLHLHTLAAECQITKLFGPLDKKTGKRPKLKFIKSGGVAEVRIRVSLTIAAEEFEVRPQMGRFTLRDEGQTIGIGKILVVHEAVKTAAQVAQDQN